MLFSLYKEALETNTCMCIYTHKHKCSKPTDHLCEYELWHLHDWDYFGEDGVQREPSRRKANNHESSGRDVKLHNVPRSQNMSALRMGLIKLARIIRG